MMRGLVLPRSYRDAVLALGPVAYWPMNDAAGTVCKDATGRNDATYVNSPTLGVLGPTSGNPSTGVSFASASSQHADCAANVATVVDNWTIIAWIFHANTSTTRTILGNGVTGSTNGWGLYLDTTHHLWGYAQGAGALTNADGAALQLMWQFAVLTRRAGTSYIYLNGKLDQTGTTTTPITPTGFTSIGADASGTGLFMDGTIAHPAVFTRSLADAEHIDLYRRARGF